MTIFGGGQGDGRAEQQGVLRHLWERQTVEKDNRHGNGHTFPKLCQNTKFSSTSRYGVEVGEVKILVHVLSSVHVRGEGEFVIGS